MTFKDVCLFLLSIFIILSPYSILFTLVCLFVNPLNVSETILSITGLDIISLPINIYKIAIVCSIIMFITSIIFKHNSQKILHLNMIIKLIHIPAYVLIFITGLLSLITIFTAGISIVLIILDVITIFISGFIGLGGVIRGVIEKKLSIKSAVIYAILQFVFCIDVVSSVILYKKVKKVA